MRALAGLGVGYYRRRTEWKRLTCCVVAVWVHFGAVRHFSACKLLSVERCSSESRAAGQVTLRLRWWCCGELRQLLDRGLGARLWVSVGFAPGSSDDDHAEQCRCKSI